MFHPIKGKARKWVDFTDDGKPRTKQKIQNNYVGHSNKLKGFPRITLRFSTVRRKLCALDELKTVGLVVLNLKIKYGSPTPIDYVDINVNIGIRFGNVCVHVGELQLNLNNIAVAKHETIVCYEQIRQELPSLYNETNVDVSELERFVVNRLNFSSLDSVVVTLSAKAGGLFLYLYLLEKYFISEKAAGCKFNFTNMSSVHAGLSDIYCVTFLRAFHGGKNGIGWVDALLCIQMITAAMEPLSVGVVQIILEWIQSTCQHILGTTALISPVRDGIIHVFHKCVDNWMTGDDANASIYLLYARTAKFAVERLHGHVKLADAFEPLNRGRRTTNIKINAFERK